MRYFWMAARKLFGSNFFIDTTLAPATNSDGDGQTWEVLKNVETLIESERHDDDHSINVEERQNCD